ncbi:hypothetical protein RB195_009256 [Necator americanus]|uniref:Uncharacterized protein n=1 Tax=Necator americanus TaxID=51031 RepID=A0ABR1CT62_NECAM
MASVPVKLSGRADLRFEDRVLSDHKIQVDQVEDQEYCSKMVQEVSGPELPAPVSESSSDDKVEPKTKTRKIRKEQRENSRVD